MSVSELLIVFACIFVGLPCLVYLITKAGTIGYYSGKKRRTITKS